MIKKAELAGKEVAFTGRLASMTEEAACELVQDLGGEVANRVTRHTDYLVFGQQGLPLDSKGRLTEKLGRARNLKDEGRPVTILSEDEFFKKLGLSQRPAVARFYTTTQLSRVLKIPGRRIRAWARAGLVKPAKEINRLLYFDFQEVATAKALSEFARSGVSIQRLRDSLAQIQTWLPRPQEPFAQLGILEEHGELFVRLDDGGRADPSGQLCLDFGDRPEPSPQEVKSDPAPRARPRSSEEWFRIAVRLEDADHLEEAASAYQESLLAGGPQEETCFNLGNVLFALDRRAEAIQRFYQAVELDPGYVEAWNNLGNALSDEGREKEAVAAFRRALAIDPHYADAHFNLAETYDQLGLEDESCEHWRAFLAADPYSPWAERVRARLARSNP